MNSKVSKLGQGEGLGSWHPAMRPNLHSATNEYEQQAEERNMEFLLAEARATEPIPPEDPIANQSFTPSQHDPLPSSYNESRCEPSVNDTPLDTVDEQHTASTSSAIADAEDGGPIREDTALGLHSSKVDNPLGSARADDLPSLSQSGEGNQNGGLHFSNSIRDATGDPQLAFPAKLASDDREGVKRLDPVGELGKPRSLLDDFGIINRTNSFPEVPPLRQPEPRPNHPLAQSQVGNIMKEDEKEPTIKIRLETSDPIEATVDGDESSFFASVGGLHSEIAKSLFDDEARYEEGLPLMQSEQAVDRSMDSFFEKAVSSHELPEASKDRCWAESEETLPEKTSFSKPQPLDRQSTSQVLDSLQHASNGMTHPQPGPASLQGVFETGDELTFPESTAIPKSAIHDLRIAAELKAETSFFGQDSKDDDLAAMWQAALGDDELLDENEPSVDPTAFFDDDGEGFLEEDQDTLLDQPQQTPSSGTMLQELNSSGSESRGGIALHHQYTPASYAKSTALSSSPYTPATGSAQQVSQATFGISHSISAPAGFNNARPSMPQSTQSFADKSKGGYTSPYDIPMDVTRPKKRNYIQQIQAGPNAQTTANIMAPPRSSSMYTRESTAVNTPPPSPSVAGVVPPMLVANAAPTLKPRSSFFEELPSVKPRLASSIGRAIHVPQKNPPRQVLSQYEPSRADPARSASSSSGMSQAYQLLPPERINPYVNTSQEPTTQQVPALISRYSPAPASQQTVPPPRNRYASSPASGPRPPQPVQILPFQPRTSSPLANQNISITQGISAQQQPQRPSVTVLQEEPMAQEFRNSTQFNPPSPPSTNSRYTPSSSSPPSSYSISAHESNGMIPTNLSYRHPQEHQQSILEDAVLGPPRRSQTQSPSAMRSRTDLAQNIKIPYQRPASVNQTSYADDGPVRSAAVYQADRRKIPITPAMNYIRPSDGRENDRLERWKGCPIFAFGFGGTIVSSFPKQIPRYTADQSIPMIKCSPGEVNICKGKAFALEENIATFPGPLRSKSKKKEVVDWLQKRILEFESAQPKIIQSSTLPDPSKRHEEKIILWRVIQILVEHDGAIEGNAVAEKAVRTVLSPELAVGDDARLQLHGSNAPLVGISRSAGSTNVSESAADLEAVEGLRKILLHGEREKAVWHAVDRRLWGHAMLLASTLGKGIWKQVLQEFNSQEVKAFGNNTESLAALYQIFAGNWEESIDQLVPPSARAGLQMVSKASTGGPMKNALDGLDRWRETLTLVLSNRTQDDGNALQALGRLLGGYGRIEAAHVCYIFAKTPGLFGGPDDPQVSVALLGVDHLQQPYDYSRDFDSILLTEVYDFARTALAPSAAVNVSPHLQSYKLYHALTLAEYGYRSEAQNYCDNITSALKSTTKLSPYYHNLLFAALEDLLQRLRQAPKDNSASIIAGLSMDKVSGSVWSRLNQFIAGDESDAESSKSGNVHDPAAGPFARIAGDSPNISRSASSNDLYGSYLPMGVASAAPATTIASNSRYAPTGQYTPRSSLEQPARPSPDFQRPAQSEAFRPPFIQQRTAPARSRSASTKASQGQQQHDLHKPPNQPLMYTPPAESYLPTPPSQPQHIPTAPSEDLSSSLYPQEPYQPSPSSEPEPSQETYRPDHEAQPNTTYTSITSDENPASSSYDPDQSNYEPPSGYGYEPPSYNPEMRDTTESSEQKSPKKKKSFIYGDEDDGDFAAKAATILKEQKAQKDREAENAFKKAAEADGTLSHYAVKYYSS